MSDEIHELSYGKTYRYLGFQECGGIDHRQAKTSLTEEFSRRLKIVWKSLLYGRFKVQATNSFCIPLLSYGFGVVGWTKSEVLQFDQLVRQVMTNANCHHTRSSVERLFLPRKLGGRGLLCVENLLEHHLIMLSYHLNTSGNALVKMCCTLDTQLPSRVSIMSRAALLVSSLGLDDMLSYSCGQLTAAIIAAQQKKLLDCLSAKPLHGKFFNWIRSVDINIDWSFRWLNRSLHSESESAIFAIQDQVISTRVYQAKIIRSRIPSVLCRFCGDQEETIQHVLAGCSILAPTCYLNRHNLVAKVLHFHLCKSFHFPVLSNSWFTHHPLPVVENNKIKSCGILIW